MNKTALIILIIGIIFVFGYIFLGDKATSSVPARDNVEVIDGVQYVRIEARGGYSPGLSVAKAGLPTKLIVTTKNTFDCSRALVVRSAGYQNILPETGETEIDLGIGAVGKPVSGVCSMGMYNFKIEFEA